MQYLTLRQWKNQLESDGQLLHVAAEVDPAWELSCVARWHAEAGHSQGLQFDRLRGHTMPVAVGLLGTLARCRQALGLPSHRQLLRQWGAALQAPIACAAVDQAAVQEHVLQGEQIRLGRLPVPVWTPGRDAGPYLPTAVVITKDPGTGIQNAAVYRIQIHDDRRTGVFFGSERQHGAMHYAKHRERGEPMPIALVLGAPPAVLLGAAAKTVYGVDELEVAGGLIGTPIPCCRGQTVDLMLPADAEIVIEGRVPQDQRMLEAPFGEGLGFMSGAAPAPVVEVTAICHRSQPFLYGCLQQLPPTEGHLLWQLGAEGPLWHYLHDRAGFEELTDVAVVNGSAGLSVLALQVQGGSSRVGRLLDTLAALNFGQKFVIAVDEDIDVRDPASVWWAVSTRADPETDIRTKPEVQTYLADPSVMARNGLTPEHSQPAPYASSLLLIDATLKCRTPEVALPGGRLMHAVRDQWQRYGLPPLPDDSRLDPLLASHSQQQLAIDPQQVRRETAGD